MTDHAQNYRVLQKTMEEYANFVRKSAQNIFNIIDVNRKSIVDFGCGRGDWLKVAKELGATDIHGLDTYSLDVDPPAIPCQRVDLTATIHLPKSFDMALCLEVAEHLPANTADTLIDSLTNASDYIVFSAAVPGQGGVGHINEQPPRYWCQKFAARGFQCYDFRHLIWNNGEIEPWYRMGVLVYSRNAEKTKSIRQFQTEEPLHLVHPDIFAAYAPIGKDLILRFSEDEDKWFPEFL